MALQQFGLGALIDPDDEDDDDFDEEDEEEEYADDKEW